MQVIKTLDTKRHTYYCGYGYITNYERTEAEKEEQRYMIIQKLIGVLAIVMASLSLLIVKTVPEIGLFTILMALMGVILILAKEHVVCL